MNKADCEKVLILKMAEMDGEADAVPAEMVTSHLGACASCRDAIDQLQRLDSLLENTVRNALEADLWPGIMEQVTARIDRGTRLTPFLLIGVLMVIYKTLEFVPFHEFGMAFKLAPLVLIVAFFVFLKENPFRIDPQIEQEAYR